jgi:hypothetical protein
MKNNKNTKKKYIKPVLKKQVRLTGKGPKVFLTIPGLGVKCVDCQ